MYSLLFGKLSYLQGHKLSIGLRKILVIVSFFPIFSRRNIDQNSVDSWNIFLNVVQILVSLSQWNPLLLIVNMSSLNFS